MELPEETKLRIHHSNTTYGIGKHIETQHRKNAQETQHMKTHRKII